MDDNINSKFGLKFDNISIFNYIQENSYFWQNQQAKWCDDMDIVHEMYKNNNSFKELSTT